MLVRHLSNVLEVRELAVAEDGGPNHLSNRATIIGMRDSDACHWWSQVKLLMTWGRNRLYPPVVFNSITDPLVVQGQWLVQ